MLELVETGDFEFTDTLTLDHATRAGIRFGLYNLGQTMRDSASAEMLRKNKTGRVYRYRGRRHRASARGETAANRSGRMRRSLDFVVQGSTQMQFGANTPYARILEEQLDRPTIRSAMVRNQRNGSNFIRQGIIAKRDF